MRKIVRKNNLLHCSCRFRSRYGLECSHVYNVVSEFEGYSEPTHHECALRWWSSYSMYGISMNSCNTENEKNLIKSFNALQRNEYSGLPVFSFSAEKIPITNEIPAHFQEGNFPLCVNFPHLRIASKDLVFDSGGVMGFTQVCSNYPEKELDDMLKTELLLTKANPKRAADNPYAELIPYFVELTSSMEGWCEDDDFLSIKNFLMSETAKFKGRAYSKMVVHDPNDSQRKRKVISSSLPSGKKIKPHGTQHF